MKMPSTAASEARLCRYSGSHCSRITWPSSQPPAAPRAVPAKMTPANVARLWLKPSPLAMMKL
ncbi:hypothetical protein D3C76_1718950 [compost metagenome]